MKRLLAGSLASVLLCGAALVAFANDRPVAAQAAQVTLTVTKFRSWTSPVEHGYVDATTTLAPHSSVAFADESGMPTLRTKGAVDFEIAVESADPAESYKPLAILFQQDAKGSAAKKDPDGRINFAQWHSGNGTLVIRDKFVHTGHEGSWEFFVIVQRASDSAIGIIDPTIINEPRDP